jgi:hypothetical protein
VRLVEIGGCRDYLCGHVKMNARAVFESVQKQFENQKKLTEQSTAASTLQQ